MLRSSFVLACSLSLFAAACGGGDDVEANPDAAVVDIDAGVTIDAAGTCDPTTALPNQWRPIASVSTGTLAVTTTGGVTSGTIDATAGGTGGAADNPYIYVDLVNGTKVDITDVASLSSTAWHLAFKRSGVKINSGDSGPGHVTAAAVDAATLAAVTTAPSGLAADDWATADCTLNATMAGEPASVMSSWYDYNEAQHTLTPKSQVWVLKLGDQSGAPVRKLRITTYYGDTTMPMRGAYYNVEWAAL